MDEVERFLEYLAGDKGYSPLTVSSYGTDLRLFRDFFRRLDEGLRWEDIDSDIVRRWVASELGRNVSPRTMRRRLSAVRALYRYLMRTGCCTHNPAHCVPNPKSGKPLPAFLKETEMNRLFDEVSFEEGFDGQRDRLVLLLLYTTGIRAAELLALKVGDIAPDAGELKVTGKRNKQRIIPFGRELKEAIAAYLPERAVRAKGTDGSFIIRNNGVAVTYHDVRRIVREYLSVVSSQQKKSPHVLRHTFATVMLNNGAGLETVKELLGHESLVATEVYTHTTFAELEKEYKRAHPRA